MLSNILTNTRSAVPLVHHITNYVTVNDCANITLACGGSPIMADDIGEAAEITSLCASLVLNIGTLNERTIPSMLAAGKMARKLGHPVVLDPVGAGASRLRTDIALSLLEQVGPSVIRGNSSEIKALCQGEGSTKGVDADQADAAAGPEAMLPLAKCLAQKTGAVVAVTGKIDVITDGTNACLISNGNPLMSKITGTGCMLSSVIGSYCGGNPTELYQATVTAVAAMGLCGQLAYGEGIGTASYRAGIIDRMSLLTESQLKEGAKIEHQ